MFFFYKYHEFSCISNTHMTYFSTEMNIFSKIQQFSDFFPQYFFLPGDSSRFEQLSPITIIISDISSSAEHQPCNTTNLYFFSFSLVFVCLHLKISVHKIDFHFCVMLVTNRAAATDNDYDKVLSLASPHHCYFTTIVSIKT